MDAFPSLESLSEPLLDKKAERTIIGYASAGIWQRICFSWLSPLLKVGSKRPLQVDDIPGILEEDTAENLRRSFEEGFGEGKWSIIYALARSNQGLVAWTALLAIVKVGVMFIGPLLIQSFTMGLVGSSWQRGGFLVGVLFLAKLVETGADYQYEFLTMRLGTRVKSALVASVYAKGLRLSNLARLDHSTGQIVNYISVDILQISKFLAFFHSLWSVPIQISIALLILYNVLQLSMLAGLGTMIMVMASCLFIASRAQKYHARIMECKDARIKRTSESLCHMKTIKLQAWQDWFCWKVIESRNEERVWIRKVLLLSSASIFLLWLSPLLVAAVTFTTCLLLQIDLTAGRVFTAIATFRILQDPLRFFPRIISMGAQAMVSLRRLEKYMHSEELDLGSVKRLPLLESISVRVDEGCFRWQAQSEEFILDRINLQIQPTSFVAIIGKVGSGKSALLAALLGEMDKLSGHVEVCGSVAYVPQMVWLQNGSIEENILFGKPFDEMKYEETLRVCTLQTDLAQMMHGDKTLIGERGVTLSGGQKQRIQLARAIYQDADIYFLDDIFSAVDAHTGTFLFKECINKVLKTKTVVLVTHQVEFLHEADMILVMNEGKIASRGTYNDLMNKESGLVNFISAHANALEASGYQQNPSEAEEEPMQESLQLANTDIDIDIVTTKDNSIKNCEGSMLNGCKTTSKPSKNTEKVEEERELGRVGKAVYWAYLTAAFKGFHVIMLFAFQICWQTLQIESDFWLADSTAQGLPTSNPIRFISVYWYLSAGSATFVLLRALLVSFAGLITAQRFYLSMINSIFTSPMSFFDMTPSGRILKRSSTDQSILDLDLPSTYGSTLASAFQVMGILFVNVRITWEILFVILPLGWVYASYQNYYIATSRELTRLEAITEAPVIDHFSEMLTGCAVIRAFGYEKLFNEVNNKLLNLNICIRFHKLASNQWIGFRIEFIGSIILSISTLMMVMLPTGLIPPDYIGLSLSYGLALNGALFSLLFFISNIEQNMVSVERIKQYCNIPCEAPQIIPDRPRPPHGWPGEGAITFESLHLRYRPDGPLVLKGLTFSIKGGEKLGVVGRTGSGKSSLILALFRMIELERGKISIDGINILSIGLKDLRSQLGIIPQDPILFNGSIRDNLDPLAEHTDDEIWKALEMCQIAAAIREKKQKLESEVSECGTNWSMGQRQLLCLGRVLLRKTRVLVLDEATASVDTQTDFILQSIINEAFSGCTILVVAHRIPSVMASDKVLVLEAGHMKGFGPPSTLLEDSKSLFSMLVQEYWKRSKNDSK